MKVQESRLLLNQNDTLVELVKQLLVAGPFELRSDEDKADGIEDAQHGEVVDRHIDKALHKFVHIQFSVVNSRMHLR